VSGRTSTDIQDCVPDVESTCLEGSHYDANFKECVNEKVCENSTLCNGEGQIYGFYNPAAKKCLCRNAEVNVEDFCDDKCLNLTLKAFITSAGKICLRAGGGVSLELYNTTILLKYKTECYDKSYFADKIFLDGIECPPSQGECDITGIRNNDGEMQGSIEADQVFVNEWKKKYPQYKSPYETV